MMTRLTMSAALCLALAAGAAAAQDDGRWGGAGFARMDADGDGVVTRAEMRTARRAVFDRIDRDGDGALSPAEIVAARERARRLAQMAEAGAGNRLDRMDGDGDGTITLAEFDGRMPVFDLLDGDGDGALSRAELERARAALMQ